MTRDPLFSEHIRTVEDRAGAPMTPSPTDRFLAIARPLDPPPAVALARVIESLLGRPVILDARGYLSTQAEIGAEIRSAVVPLWPECPRLFGCYDPASRGLCIVTDEGVSLFTAAVTAGATNLVDALREVHP